MKNKLELELSKKEQSLILENVPARKNLLNKVRLCIVRDNKMYACMTEDELFELSGNIAITSDMIENIEISDHLETVLTKISNLINLDDLDIILDMFSSGELPPMPPEVKELIDAELEKDEETDFDELQEKINALMKQAVNKPYLELNGLTIKQTESLILSDWSVPGSAMYINQDLSCEDLKDSQIFHNARLFLSKIINGEHVETTRKGKLCRKFVVDMFEKMKMDEYEREIIVVVNKVLNEEDVEPLHNLKIVFELSGLLKKRKNRFYVPKKDHDILSDPAAGVLYSLLFVAFFREFNLAYLDGAPDCELLQDSIPYSLYMISGHADDWIQFEDLLDLILLPLVVKTIEPAENEAFLAMNRIIEPLIEFGLLEKMSLTEDKWLMAPCKLRKTALFDKFINFNIEPADINEGPFH